MSGCILVSRNWDNCGESGTIYKEDTIVGTFVDMFIWVSVVCVEGAKCKVVLRGVVVGKQVGRGHYHGS